MLRRLYNKSLVRPVAKGAMLRRRVEFARGESNSTRVPDMTHITTQAFATQSRLLPYVQEPVNTDMKYRKLPLISPGLIQLRKGFWVDLYPGGL